MTSLVFKTESFFVLIGRGDPGSLIGWGKPGEGCGRSVGKCLPRTYRESSQWKRECFYLVLCFTLPERFCNFMRATDSKTYCCDQFRLVFYSLIGYVLRPIRYGYLKTNKSNTKMYICSTQQSFISLFYIAGCVNRCIQLASYKVTDVCKIKRFRLTLFLVTFKVFW